MPSAVERRRSTRRSRSEHRRKTEDSGLPQEEDHINEQELKPVCTDCAFLILYILYLIAWGAIYAYVRYYIKPTKIGKMDLYGRLCGKDEGVSEKPYLFYFDPSCYSENCHSPQICVSHCPNHSWATLPYRSRLKRFDVKDVQKNLICQNEEFNAGITSLEKLIKSVQNKNCADWYVKSKPVNYICVPSEEISQSKTFIKSAETEEPVDNVITELASVESKVKIADTGVIGKIVEDIRNGWIIISVSIISGALISFMYILILKFNPQSISWLSILSLLVICASGAVYCFYKYVHNGEKLQGGHTSKTYHLVVGIVLTIIAVWTFIVIIFCRKNIKAATILIAESGQAITDIISSLFFPIIPSAWQVLVLIWTVFLCFKLLEVTEFIYNVQGFENNMSCNCSGRYMSIKNGDDCDPSLFKKLCENSTTGAECINAECKFSRSYCPPLIAFFLFLNFFGAYWSLNTAFGFSDVVLSGMFGDWYWTPDKKVNGLPHFMLIYSILVALRYHLGTVIFGSLFVAVCSIIRKIIGAIMRQFKDSHHPALAGIYNCFKSILHCCKHVLEYVNRDAFVLCGLHGENFCKSGKTALQLLNENIDHVLILNSVTGAIFGITKLLITLLIVVLAFLALGMIDKGHYYYGVTVPLVVIGIGTYCVSSLMIGVYSMAVDAIFFCILEDSLYEEPYLMSNKLRDTLVLKINE